MMFAVLKNDSLGLVGVVRLKVQKLLLPKIKIAAHGAPEINYNMMEYIWLSP